VEAVAAAAADYVLWGWRTAAGGIVQLWVGGLDAWFCVDLVGIVIGTLKGVAQMSPRSIPLHANVG